MASRCNIISIWQTHLYDIGGRPYQELTLVAEGGYGYVWRALDVTTKKIAILKKQLCTTPEAVAQTEREVNIHKSLGRHPNIVECYGGTTIVEQGRKVTLIAMEMCEGGTLFDLLHRHREKRLNDEQILYILRHLIAGIVHMHSQRPAVAHRDIKVENILLHEKVFKFCDFGSASTDVVDLGAVSKQEASRFEEEFEKNTTLMYRPPEMSDIYQRFEVSTKVDIWMLGCVLYTMMFYVHPFQDASKLAIVQADFRIPKPHKFSEKMIMLLHMMLTPNPRQRASIYEIQEVVANFYHSIPAPISQPTQDQTHQPIQQKLSSQPTPSAPPKNQDDFDDFQQAPQTQQLQSVDLMDF